MRLVAPEGNCLVLRAAVMLLLALVAACHKPAPADQVAVKGDGFEITLAELEQELKNAPPQPQDQIKAARRQVLDALIDQKLLAQAAIKGGLDKDTQTVQAIEAAKRAILAQAYIDRIIDPASPDATNDSRFRAYYDQHPDRYAARAKLQIQEIELPLERTDSAMIADLDRLGFDRLVARLAAEGKAPPVVSTSLLSDRVEGNKPPVGANVIYRTGDDIHLGKVIASDPAPIAFEDARADVARRMTEEQNRGLIGAAVARMRKEQHVQVVNKDLKRALQ